MHEPQTQSINKPQLSARRRRIFLLVELGLLCAVILVLAEATAYFILVTKAWNYYFPLELADRQNIPEPEAPRTEYYFELGWEPKYPNDHGYRGEPKNLERAAVAVFGDSYTEAYPDIELSWPYLLEQQLGRPVLNFGVAGYGTDQSYLRFERRYLNKVKTPYVAMFVMSENIARIVSTYRGFYVRLRDSRPTKPRFVADENGELELLPNPISAPSERARLWDEDFLHEIGQTDHWYSHYGEYGLNEFVRFPHTYMLIKALPYYLHRAYLVKIENQRIYDPLYDDPETIAILRAILNRFVDRAAEQGAVPLVIFLPNWKDMTDIAKIGDTIYSDFVDEFRNDGHPLTFDAIEFFRPHLSEDESPDRFFRSRDDDHYNPAGEEIISEGMHSLLLSVDASEGYLSDESSGMRRAALQDR